jgi:hypothetical protein
LPHAWPALATFRPNHHQRNGANDGKLGDADIKHEWSFGKRSNRRTDGPRHSALGLGFNING